MERNHQIEIVKNFIHAYNKFDIEGMLKDLHKDIKFENISDGKINLETNGIEEFTEQAESSKKYFRERNASIIDIEVKEDKVEVSIDYFGILAKDIPGGMSSGDTIRLQGKSVYKFMDNKIIGIKDIS